MLADPPNEAPSVDTEVDGVATGETVRKSDIEQAEPATAEEQELAAALAAVLARKPRRSSAQPLAAPAESSVEISDGDTALVTPTARRAFVSALRHQASPTPTPTAPFADTDGDAEGDSISDTAPGGNAGWLAAARRRTVRRKLKAAGAWVATVALGSAIVIIAAAILFEGPRDLEAWLDLARRTM